MDKKSALGAIDHFRLALESKNIRIHRVILYGSFAQGRAREGSDIDVLVISNSFSGKDYWERIEILSEAIYEVFEPIEAVGLTIEEWEKGESVIVDFAREGETIYAAYE
jgi:predicted nucleotidyltransferase